MLVLCWSEVAAGSFCWEDEIGWRSLLLSVWQSGLIGLHGEDVLEVLA